MAGEHIEVSGIAAPVDILVDRWGVSHIRASGTADLFFAQGFNAARDRLWQIDLWRKRGLGLLAADFGPGYLAQDRAARLFLDRGDMDAEWAAYGGDARSICEAFVAGVNAYVDVVDRHPDRLPLEFVRLRTRPARWNAADVVRIRTHGWLRNALSEATRAAVMARADAAADRLRLALEPPVVPEPAPGLDLAGMPPDVLDAYRLATAPVTFSAARLGADMADAWRWRAVTPDGDVSLAAAAPASNNWAVHGDRTTTGRPVLASDPHRLHAVPSLRHLVHLSAPGLDLIGAVEPHFPGITIGHNEDAAFGLTLFLGPDQEDLHVYEASPDGARSYRYGGGWEPLRLVEETFEIKGAAPIVMPLAFTRHGPVVYEDPTRGRIYALRTVWTEPGTAPYGAALLAMRARTCDEFRTALRRWKAPAVNYVYADRTGSIAWITAGLAPVRRSWDGLLPVPGDGRYEWEGFLDPGLLPSAVNPPAGFVASANAFNLPPSWDRHAAPMGYEWDDPSRRDRIDEVLSADRRHSVEASCALQTDVVSLPARRLCALVAPLSPADPDAHAALDLLDRWDHRLTADSPAAALFEVWWTRRLRPAVLERLVPDSRTRALLGAGDVGAVLDVLEAGMAGRLDAEPSGFAAMLLATLAEAHRDCRALMGMDAAAWAWGRLQHWRVQHALSVLDPDDARFDVGPLAVGGSESTLMKGTYRPSDFRVTLGASVRLVMDVGDWDRSVWINAPGQSGDPRSPHYADLAAPWARGEYVPMLFSEQAVTTGAVTTIRLEPASPAGSGPAG
ncbi:MAG: penicillin acylase family protein [Acidobacteria bacterium]|nr:penicillin acylase family protein [Acidobacteriota bacterium]